MRTCGQMRRLRDDLFFSVETMRNWRNSAFASSRLFLMKAITAFVLSAAFVSILSCNAVRAEEGNSKKLDLEKAKGALEKLAGEAKKALGKGDDHNTIWPKSKETLALPMAEYVKRAEGALKMADAEVRALAEAESPVNGRDYFKTRVESLKLQHAYCSGELAKLKDIGAEDDFRVKQKKFDRVLTFFAETIALAKEEAGV